MIEKYYQIKSIISTFIYICFIGLRYPNVILGENLKIFGGLNLSIQKSSVVNIGSNIIFRSATRYNYIRINRPVIIAVCNYALLSIGNNTGFSGTSIFVMEKIIIGDNCSFGANTAIGDTDFHSLNYMDRRVNDIAKINSSPIEIGNDVFVGANTIILKGIKIGDRAIIGAGSVVTKHIPPDEIWAGNPARFLKINSKEVN